MPDSSNLPHPQPQRRRGGQSRPRRPEESRPKLHGGNRRSSRQPGEASLANRGGSQHNQKDTHQRGTRHHQGEQHKPRRGKQATQQRRTRRPILETTPPFRPFTPEQLAARAAAIPVVSFPDLPVSARKDDIAQAIRDHQVVIVAGETGSGKTTQLPKIALQLGRGVEGMIGHTQPRRIAAHAVATRIAHELGQKVSKDPGNVVGYQVRFTDHVGPTTLVKLMTDGILLAEIQSDPLLRRYDTLIIDEAHERSLNIDFILGYLARLLPLRPDLKVIITSATIDSARFAEHFGRWEDEAGRQVTPGKGRLVSPAPVIEVSGRTYPVEVRYRPLSADLPSQWTSQSSASAGHNADDDTHTEQRSATEEAERSLHFRQLVLEDPDDDLPTLGYGLGEDIDQETAIAAAVDELMAEGPGDILVFLPGERDIRDVQQALADHLGSRAITESSPPRKHLVPDSVEIIPLYARLTAAEQQRIFEPHSLRRIVLATNVAETSLTVPGIRYVIDPGLARISRYSNKTKVQRLPIEAISQASANQRAGRSGRLEDGVAIRLYSQRDYEARPAFTEPEILRTSLASVILQMAALGLGAVEDFPFLDAPDPRAVRDGVQLLVEIGALEYEASVAPSGDEGAGGRRPAGSSASRRRKSKATRLTAIGRDLARLPIDPRLGRILLEADANGAASEVLIIVAALSLQDVRERPLDSQGSADAAHARFIDPHSDFITYLNLWRYLSVQQRDLSGSQFRKMCRAEYLHYLRWREWRDIVNQLTQLAKPLDLSIHPIGEPSPADIAHAAQTGGIQDAAARAVVAYTASHRTVDSDQIHRSLLVGLLSNLGSWDEAKRDYEGARGTHFTIWPGSGLARSHPAWVMTAELVETSRLFARTVARIEPEWIEPVAEPLLKRVYSEPFWSASKGAAMVKEKVLLYGLTVTADRPVLLGRVDTVLSEGASRRSSVARPGTLAGIAQGLRAAEPRFDVRITGIDRLAEWAAKGAEQFSADSTTAENNTSEHTVFAVQDDLAPTVHEDHPSGISAKELAREMFIRHALVRGEWREVHRFQKDNEERLEQAREVERRSRTHGLVADEDARFAFFDDIIPESIISSRHFDQWWKRERRERPDLLTYPTDLLLPRGTGKDTQAFPNSWIIEHGVGRSGHAGDEVQLGEDAIVLPLSYQFSPGSQRDGVTLTIPVELLERVTEAGTDWLVPGLFDELVTEYIRALPKSKRRLLAPAPEVGASVARWIRDRIEGRVPGSELSSPTASPHATPHDSTPDSAASAPGKAEEVDPMSLSAAMDRLAAWGAKTGQTRTSKSSAQASSKKTIAPSAQESKEPSTEHDVSAGESSRGTDLACRRFTQWLTDGVRNIRGVDLLEADCEAAREALPPHLLMTFVVVDRSGKELGSGTSLPHLQKTLARQADTAIRTAVRDALTEAMSQAGIRQPSKKAKKAKNNPQVGKTSPIPPVPVSAPTPSASTSLHHDGLLAFPSDPLPRTVDSVGAGGMALRGYPALVPQGNALTPSAGIRVMANPSQADRQHRLGLAHLLDLRLSLSNARITTRWTGRQAAMLAASPYPTTADLVADAQLASALSLVDELAPNSDPSAVRDAAAFEELATKGRQLHEDRVYEIIGYTIRALEAFAQAQSVVQEYADVSSMADIISDARSVMTELVYPGFIAATPGFAMPHLARYLKALAVRLPRAASGAIDRDLDNLDVIEELEATLDDAREAAGARPYNASVDQHLTNAQWMIHELRVSLFAQTLGTPQKVSAKRVRALLSQVH